MRLQTEFEEGLYAMNYRSTYILFGILIGIIVLVSLAWLASPEYKPTDRDVLPSVHGQKPITADQIVRVEIDRERPDKETIVFERTGDANHWEITGPRSLRANNSVVEGLVSDLLGAQLEAHADVPANAQAAELDPPAESVVLKTKDGKELKLNLGKEAAPGPSALVYVSTPERPNQILPVLKSGVESAFKKLNDFRDPYLLASSTSDYQFVKLSLEKADKKDAPKVSLVLDKKDDGLWQYKDPEGYDGSAEEGDASVPSDPHKPPSGVNGLLKELSDLRVENTDKESDFVEDDAKDLAKYNLDPQKSDVLTIDVDRIEAPAKDESGAAQTPKTTPVKLLVGIGKKVDDKTDKYYAALVGEHGNTVVKVATRGPDAIALLFKDPTVLCNHNLAALGAFKKPVAVRVVNGSGQLDFRRENGDSLDWRLYRGGEEIAADSQAISAFVNQLVQPNQVRSFLDPKSDPDKLGLKNPAAVVSIWTDGVVKEEPKKDEAKDKDAKDKDKEAPKKEEAKPKLVMEKDKEDKPAARLTFGAVEDKLVVVKREANHKDWSESALVKAPDLLLDQAKAGPLAYYDKKLPKFGPEFDLPDKGVVKLTLDRGGEHFVISRAEAKPESPWKFDEPKEMAGRKADPSAVQAVLSALDGLKATRLVAENPKDEDLDKEYGLKTPAVKAEVTKDDKSAYTYDFGKDAADGSEYALQSQRPKMVFAVSKFDLAPLQKDLQDRTIFAFDPAKVKTLKMTGWQKTSGGELLTRELERKDDKTWTVKTPANLAMNFDKVNKLVEELSHLQADRFVTRNAAVKAAYDKDESKSVFTVELTVEGEKEPLVLKVVDLTGDKALPEPDRQVYATTPRLPNELFQVKRTIFMAQADKPTEIGPMDQAAYFAK